MQKARHVWWENNLTQRDLHVNTLYCVCCMLIYFFKSKSIINGIESKYHCIVAHAHFATVTDARGRDEGKAKLINNHLCCGILHLELRLCSGDDERNTLIYEWFWRQDVYAVSSQSVSSSLCSGQPANWCLKTFVVSITFSYNHDDVTLHKEMYFLKLTIAFA